MGQSEIDSVQPSSSSAADPCEWIPANPCRTSPSTPACSHTDPAAAALLPCAGKSRSWLSAQNAEVPEPLPPPAASPRSPPAHSAHCPPAGSPAPCYPDHVHCVQKTGGGFQLIPLDL